MNYNNDCDIIKIGTIELTNIAEEFLQEMKIGQKTLGSKIGFCEIFVRNSEGPKPHFHITSKSDNDWECCIEIYRPVYFSHGSKQGTLNNKQISKLIEWLSSRCDFDEVNMTNWEFISLQWHACGNPMTNVPSIKKQPDYTRLNG